VRPSRLGGMQQTTQPSTADVEYIERQLFPSEPPRAAELMVEEGKLPYELGGAEPDAIMVRVAERFGLPQRVLVAPAQDEEDGEYRVLEDPRWVQAAREAGVERIPVRVLDVGGLTTELLVLILGQQRPANVAAQVDALERLLAAGIPEGELARASGMTISRLRRLAGLMNLDPLLRQALRDSRIKAPVAFTAAALPADVQAELAAAYEREGQLTSAQVREVRERMGADDGEERTPEEPAVGQLLQEALGTVAATEQAPGGDPTEQVRRQAEQLLQTLQRTDLPDELGARLAAVLEDIQRVPA
jgi:ParB-like chromosome segregation protein Spo0J